MSTSALAPHVTVTFPGVKARDTRTSVTLEEPGTPWPITLYFLRIQSDGQPPEGVLINVGFELGERFEKDPTAAALSLEHLPRPLDPVTVQRVADRYAEYVEYARAALAFQHSAKVAPSQQARGTNRRRELTDDFLRTIAAEYQAWKSGRGRAVTQIATAHGVQTSTASRWVKAARNAGYIAD